jgi:hypothetical protein
MPPNPSVHRTAAAVSDCGRNVAEPPRPVTFLFGGARLIRTCGGLLKESKMRAVLIVILAAWSATTARADAGDDTLKYYLSKADLVVLGEVTSDPVGVTSAATVTDFFEFKIAQVLKGNGPAKGTTMKVSTLHYAFDPEDQPRELRKGGKCILFLKAARPKESPAWATVDPWFGVQPVSSFKVWNLARLAADEASAPKK